MTPQNATFRQRPRVPGFIALVIVLFEGLLLPRLLLPMQVEMWGSTACYFAGAVLAASAFPSALSIIALCLLAVWSSDDGYLFIRPHFEAVLGGFVLAGAAFLHRRTRATSSLLLMIGASGFAAMFTLHAFSPQTHGLALDGFVWSHWAYQSVALLSAAALLCFPIGVAMIVRAWRGRI